MPGELVKVKAGEVVYLKVKVGARN